jgi:AraC family cel operon transcriptional repressor
MTLLANDRRLPRLPWTGESRDGGPVHVARHTLLPGALITPHRHGFAEVFWIESGEGEHLLVHGREALAPGDVYCIRPDDAHGVRAGRRGLVLVNISFPVEPLRGLARHCGVAWPWSPSAAAPRKLQPLSAGMERLHGWIGELVSPGVGQRDLDAFLLDVVRLQVRSAEHDGPPAWLEQACTTFAAPPHLAGGTTALARLAGKGAAHLNRQVQRWHHCTATELVGRLRIDWVGRELRLTQRPIAELAAAAGMPHLGHFYRRFHARFGTTPRRYRLSALRLMGG